MWEAAGKIFTEAPIYVMLLIAGSVLLFIGVSRKWKILPEGRKWLNRAGLVTLFTGLGLLIFNQIVGYLTK